MAFLYWDGNGPHYGRSGGGTGRADNNIWSTSAQNWADDEGSDRGEVPGEPTWDLQANAEIKQTYAAWSNGNTPVFGGALAPITINGTVSIADFLVKSAMQSNIYVVVQDEYKNEINQTIFDYFNYFSSPVPTNLSVTRSIYSMQSQGDVDTSETLTISNGTMSLNGNCEFDIQHYLPIRTSKVTISSKLEGNNWYKDGYGTLEVSNSANTSQLTSILSGTVIAVGSGSLGNSSTTVNLYSQLFLKNFYDLNVSVDIYEGNYRTEELYNSNPLNPATSLGYIQISQGSCALKTVNIIGNRGSESIIDFKSGSSLYIEELRIGNGTTQLEIIGDGNLTVNNITFDGALDSTDTFIFSAKGNLVINGTITGNAGKKIIFNSHKGERMSNEVNFAGAGKENANNTSTLSLKNENTFSGIFDIRKGKVYIEHESAIKNASIYNYNNSQILIDLKTNTVEPSVSGSIYLLTKGEITEPLKILNTGSLSIENLYLYYEGKNVLVNDFDSVFGNYDNFSSADTKSGKTKIVKTVSFSGASYNYIKIKNLYARDFYDTSGFNSHKPSLYLDIIEPNGTYLYNSNTTFAFNNILNYSNATIDNIYLKNGRIVFNNNSSNTKFTDLFLENSLDNSTSGSIEFNSNSDGNHTFNIVNNYGRIKSISVPTNFTASLTGYVLHRYGTINKIGTGKLVLAGSGTTGVYAEENDNICWPSPTYFRDSLIRFLNVKEGILEGSSSYSQYSTASHEAFTSWYPGTKPTTKNWDNLSINTKDLVGNTKIDNLKNHRRFSTNRKVGLDNISGKNTTINVSSGSTLEISNLNLSVGALQNFGTVKNTNTSYTASIYVGYSREPSRIRIEEYSGSAYYYKLSDESPEGYTDEEELLSRPELKKYIIKKIDVTDDFNFYNYDNECNWFYTDPPYCLKSKEVLDENSILVKKDVPLEPGDENYKECRKYTFYLKAKNKLYTGLFWYSLKYNNFPFNSIIDGQLVGNIQLVNSNTNISGFLKINNIQSYTGGLITLDTITVNNPNAFGTKIISVCSPDLLESKKRPVDLIINTTGTLFNDIALDGYSRIAVKNNFNISGNIYVSGERVTLVNNYYDIDLPLWKRFANRVVYPTIISLDYTLPNNPYQYPKEINISGNIIKNDNNAFISFKDSNINLYCSASNLDNYNFENSTIKIFNNTSLPTSSNIYAIEKPTLDLNGKNSVINFIGIYHSYDPPQYNEEGCALADYFNNYLTIVNTSNTSSTLTLESFNPKSVRFNAYDKLDVIIKQSGVQADTLGVPNNNYVKTLTVSGAVYIDDYSINAASGTYITSNLIIRKKLTAAGGVYPNNISFNYNNTSIDGNVVLNYSGSQITCHSNAQITGALRINSGSFLKFEKLSY